MKIEVGMKLWWVDTDRRSIHPEGREVAVTKVGRKWANLNNTERFDITTMMVDSGGYTPCGAIYESKESYLQQMTIQKVWKSFQQKVQYQYRPPTGVSLEDIEQANKLLFGEP